MKTLKTLKTLTKAIAACGLCLVVGTVLTGWFKLTRKTNKASQTWSEMVEFVTDANGDLSNLVGE